ncbi:hypothetical protein NUW54_g11679 [Trametes sanguinea]|uniref:Uncharacterized protein n=1 Tax=Trametes sanguinea TaxID=158606 RepID=A0ACC1NA51_9APHY|nr:hypothetical protein NUW54_g11679 [Trametes sanguinea]
MPETQQEFTWIYVDPHTGKTSRQRPKGRTEELKGKLRRAFNRELRKRSGDPYMHMWYTPDGFARHVVSRCRVKFDGWPKDIPFVDIGDIGGISELERLLDMWDKGLLRIVAASRKDRANAKEDPASVHPNPSMLYESEAIQSRRKAVVVSSEVFDLDDDMRPLGVHPTSTYPSAADLPEHERSQRSDVKKARARPVTNPDNLPLRTPERRRQERAFRDPAGARGWSERAGQCNDPLNEFHHWNPESDVECDGSSGISLSGMSSDVDGFEMESEFESAGALRAATAVARAFAARQQSNTSPPAPWAPHDDRYKCQIQMAHELKH